MGAHLSTVCGDKAGAENSEQREKLNELSEETGIREAPTTEGDVLVANGKPIPALSVVADYAGTNFCFITKMD